MYARARSGLRAEEEKSVNKPKLTPMMQQYMEIKERYKDCILFFRLGDFYEMFFDDALLASRELEITLTGRDCGLWKEHPCAEFPIMPPIHI
mgnify:CR=1 FL=1